MTTSISDSGLQFADTNVINSAAAMPSTGSYTTGTVVLNNTASTNAKLLGWKRLTTGSGHVLNTDWTELVSGLTLTASQASTSGTSIDFTGIPSWVKRITILLDVVSTSGTSPIAMQLGDAGGVETTGYSSYAVQDGAAPTRVSPTTCMAFTGAVVAANTYSGIAELVLMNSATNKWSFKVLLGNVGQTTNQGGWGTGVKSLSATLDRVRVTMVNGTDTFDAGSMNIIYE